VEFTEKELSRLPFKVIGDIDYFAEYPSLKNYKAFNDEILGGLMIPFNNLFRYVVLLYTPNTPLMNITDHNKRKAVALQMSDIDGAKNIDLVSCRNPLYNMIIMGYLRLMKSHRWAKLCVFTDAYYNQCAKLQAGLIEPGERTKELKANINDLEADIEFMTNEFVNFDNSPKLRDAVTQAVEDQHNELLPETIASLISEGDDPTREWSPYASS